MLPSDNPAPTRTNRNHIQRRKLPIQHAVYNPRQVYRTVSSKPSAQGSKDTIPTHHFVPGMTACIPSLSALPQIFKGCSCRILEATATMDAERKSSPLGDHLIRSSLPNGPPVYCSGGTAPPFKLFFSARILIISSTSAAVLSVYSTSFVPATGNQF